MMDTSFERPKHEMNVVHKALGTNTQTLQQTVRLHQDRYWLAPWQTALPMSQISALQPEGSTCHGQHEIAGDKSDKVLALSFPCTTLPLYECLQNPTLSYSAA